MKRFVSWKWFRRGLIGVAVLITLLAVVWTVENIRGNRAWSQYKTQMEAKGEVFDWQAFVPPPVPDEKNLALAPVFAPLDYAWKGKPAPEIVPIEIDIHLTSPGKHPPSDKQDLFNLEAYQEFFQGNTNYPQSAQPQTAAEDILVALSRFDQALEGLHHAAKERPLSRFPIRYEDNFEVLLPHLNLMRALTRTLCLRSVAQLELGKNEEAFRDAQLAFRLADSMKDEPLLISYLVRKAMNQQNARVVKEGILRHAWNDKQLEILQTYYSNLDLLKDFHLAIRGERAMFIQLLDAIGRGEYSLSELTNPGTVPPNRKKTGFFPLPRGWLNQNKKMMSDWHHKYTLGAVDLNNRRIFPSIPESGEEMLSSTQSTIPNPHDVFARLLLPAVIQLSQRTAQHQTTIDQTVIACALERFYLANKRYPESLQDLVPQFISSLPHDVVTGGPLKYQLTSNGFYRLYSVGWDGKDDGGKFVERNSKEARAGTPSDWIWQFPE